jgi:NAD(P)-dependent dehydrogenase (short-subunit alcohol dehydrogenase family)
MADLIVTGASRGIGRALALACPTGSYKTLVLVARDVERLERLQRELAERGQRAEVVGADLTSLAAARIAGERIAQLVGDGATLVHGAGIWPARRERTPDGLEPAFVINCLAPLALQAPLVNRLARVLVLGAGLMIKGQFHRDKTPTGADFSGFRTYATTKLAGALAMRDAAAAHPALDVAVIHPGVVNTDLGARDGLIGWMLRRAKRTWETPEVCAARLVRMLARPRWSPPGDARWFVEGLEHPWPDVAEVAATRAAVREVTARLLAR